MHFKNDMKMTDYLRKRWMIDLFFCNALCHAFCYNGNKNSCEVIVVTHIWTQKKGKVNSLKLRNIVTFPINSARTYDCLYMIVLPRQKENIVVKL